MDETNNELSMARVTKQLLMDEIDEGIHTSRRTKQLLMDETSEGLPIPDDVQNIC